MKLRLRHHYRLWLVVRADTDSGEPVPDDWPNSAPPPGQIVHHCPDWHLMLTDMECQPVSEIPIDPEKEARMEAEAPAVYEITDPTIIAAWDTDGIVPTLVEERRQTLTSRRRAR